MEHSLPNPIVPVVWYCPVENAKECLEYLKQKNSMFQNEIINYVISTCNSDDIHFAFYMYYEFSTSKSELVPKLKIQNGKEDDITLSLDHDISQLIIKCPYMKMTECELNW